MKKKPTFMVHYKITGIYEAKIQAISLKEALEKAEQMSTVELNKIPGDVLNEEHKITAVFE